MSGEYFFINAIAVGTTSSYGGPYSELYGNAPLERGAPIYRGSGYFSIIYSRRQACWARFVGSFGTAGNHRTSEMHKSHASS